MKFSKIFKVIIISLFVIFMSIYLASINGYYEYETKKQKELTDDAIKRFEKDVQSGKQVNINDYLVEDVKHYDNNITTIADNVSETFNSLLMKGFEKSFELVEKVIE